MVFLAAGALVAAPLASSRAQGQVVTATLEYRAPADGRPRPNFSPKGTQIPLTSLVESATLPEGSVRPAKTGTIKVGPDDKAWIPILVTADSAHPADLTRLYLELVRLAFPRRVYTQSHVDYVAEVVLHIATLAHRIRGVRIVQSPPVLRHFTAHLAPVTGQLMAR